MSAESKFTPGSWRARGESVVAHRQIPNAGKHGVHETSVFGAERPFEERLANARLIAAAPDLVAALQECVAALAGPDVDPEYALGTARAALDKAGVKS